MGVFYTHTHPSLVKVASVVACCGAALPSCCPSDVCRSEIFLSGHPVGFVAHYCPVVVVIRAVYGSGSQTGANDMFPG